VLLEEPRLVVAPVEDGVILEVGAVLELVGGASSPPIRLVLGGLAGHHGHRLAGAVLGPQLLSKSFSLLAITVLAA